MTPIEIQLDKIGDKNVKIIRGISIIRSNDTFIIDDVCHTIQDAAKYIQINNKDSNKFPYEELAFLLKKPMTNNVVSVHQVANRKQHVELLELAKKKKCYIYYADIEGRNNKWYAIEPHVLDWESVDNLHNINNENTVKENIVKENIIDENIIDENIVKENNDCPYCGKKISSTPGRTLHVKSKHFDQYQEYLNKRNIEKC